MERRYFAWDLLLVLFSSFSLSFCLLALSPLLDLRLLLSVGFGIPVCPGALDFLWWNKTVFPDLYFEPLLSPKGTIALPVCVLLIPESVSDASISETKLCRHREDRVTMQVFHINQSVWPTLIQTTDDMLLINGSYFFCNIWIGGWGWGGTCGEVPSKALTIFFTELLDLLSGLPFPILEPQGSSNLEAFLTPLCSNKFLEAFILGYTFIPENTALSCKSSSETLFRSLGCPSPLLCMLEIFSMSRLDNGLSDKNSK